MIEFGDLPTLASTVGPTPKYRKEASILRDNPGQWARLIRDVETVQGNQSFVGNINRGALKSFPRGEFESKVRNNQVWIRYVGPV